MYLGPTFYFHRCLMCPETTYHLPYQWNGWMIVIPKPSWSPHSATLQGSSMKLWFLIRAVKRIEIISSQSVRGRGLERSLYNWLASQHTFLQTAGPQGIGWCMHWGKSVQGKAGGLCILTRLPPTGTKTTLSMMNLLQLATLGSGWLHLFSRLFGWNVCV